MDVKKLDHQYCEWKKLTPPDKKSSLDEPMAKFVFAPESENSATVLKLIKMNILKLSSWNINMIPLDVLAVFAGPCN